MRTTTIGGVLAFALATFCCVLFASCAVLEAIFLGCATGAAATKTPEGAVAGAAAGLVVGTWDYIVASVKSLFHAWFGGGVVVPPPSPFNPIILWAVVFLILYAAYKFISDHKFRSHLGGGILSVLNPKPQRKQDAP